MARLGAEPAGIARMIGKAVHFVVEVYDVRTSAALILKEEMLSKGGDAAIHRDCITNKVDRSDVLLMGSEQTIRRVIESLHAQPFALPPIADEIRDALDNFKRETPVRPPDDRIAEPIRRFYDALEERTLIMGVLNVTPDSFSDGGLYANVEAAVAHGIRMAADGADIIDVGGESSRPGAEPVPLDEQEARVLPVIQALAGRTDALISIDTYKPEVAQAALGSGACILNDITGLANPAMRALVADRRVPAVIMHMKGSPQTMQDNPVYDDVVAEVMSFFRERIGEAMEAGVPRELIIVDPGIGFGKTAEHNLEIIRKLGDFKSLGLPILIGTSRKAFIGSALGGLPPTERVEGTAATVALSIANGANIVRVHDVKEMARVARMTDAVVRGG